MSKRSILDDMLKDVFLLSKKELGDEITPDDVENWTSVSHMDLMARFEDEFGLQFDVEEITEMDSLGAIRKALRKHGIDV
jgi:acyl carrier protein